MKTPLTKSLAIGKYIRIFRYNKKIKVMLVIYFLFITISWTMQAIEGIKSFIKDQINKHI
jgi:hypothetical protein